MREVFAFAYCTIAIYPPKEASGSFEEGGALSRRGWISQERALSRRTIHVVGEQMYWECGSVVWDKSSDKGVRPRNALGSSLFPMLDGAEQPEDALSGFQSTFILYSGLELTVKKDRPVALASLEFRLDNHYNTKSVYGIVRRFLGETLF
ncbi:0e1c2821-314f-4fbb-81fb-7a526422fb93 [Sclerotinia trifoliorum]|uniref:0e1c2821-314f-4fbb-81fb-7a526422fb93 n=1 Tax=Sclerotinia trifoliorum TaxID=28548 RepID=A0A8H2VSR3_9HELO|nr:0e1c2821-314f-4fbb-81fb-7a526422fb93 [Sclerotinia trifoliorum]